MLAFCSGHHGFVERLLLLLLLPASLVVALGLLSRQGFHGGQAVRSNGCRGEQEQKDRGFLPDEPAQDAKNVHHRMNSSC